MAGDYSSQELLFLELVGGFNSQEQVVGFSSQEQAVGSNSQQPEDVEGKQRTAEFCRPFQHSGHETTIKL